MIFLYRKSDGKEDFSVNEDTVRTAMLFALGYLYENRSNPDYEIVNNA